MLRQIVYSGSVHLTHLAWSPIVAMAAKHDDIITVSVSVAAGVRNVPTLKGSLRTCGVALLLAWGEAWAGDYGNSEDQRRLKTGVDSFCVIYDTQWWLCLGFVDGCLFPELIRVSVHLSETLTYRLIERLISAINSCEIIWIWMDLCCLPRAGICQFYIEAMYYRVCFGFWFYLKIFLKFSQFWIHSHLLLSRKLILHSLHFLAPILDHWRIPSRKNWKP